MSGAPAVIFDNGSGLCKAGFSGDQAPKSVIMSLVGRCHPTAKFSLMGVSQKDYYVGEDDRLVINLPTTVRKNDKGVSLFADLLDSLAFLQCSLISRESKNASVRDFPSSSSSPD